MSVFLDSTTLSFYISFLGILGMLGFKVSEIRSGKKTLLSKLADKTDGRLRKYYSTLRIALSYVNKKSAIALVQWIAFHVLSRARSIYIWIQKKAHAHPPSKRVIDMVRGRGEIKKNSGVSFFLKSISSDDTEEEVKK